MALTITEAIAELKTLSAKVDKKREFIGTCLARQEAFKDPHAKDGGSSEVIARETQAIQDLLERSLSLRRAISAANTKNTITVSNITRSIADWLCWRREIAPGIRDNLNKMQRTINDLRKQAQTKNWAIATASEAASKPTDLIINVNEVQLQKGIELIEEILGSLDGQLSLKNATLVVEI